MQNPNLKYLDYFFVLRPTLFFPVWTVFLANYHANGHFSQMEATSVNYVALLTAAFAITLMMGSMFIINQIRDIETDRKNQKLFIVANGYIKPRDAIIEAVVLGGVSLVLGFLLSQEFLISLIAVFIVTGIFYNLKPFVWKDKPWPGVFANFLGGMTVASAGWIAAGSGGWRFTLHAFPYAIGLVAVYFLTTLADKKGDIHAGKVTFGVKYGFRTSVYFALLFEIVTVVLSFFLMDMVLFIPALVSLPFFVMAVINQTVNSALKAVKYTVLFASLAVCVVFPAYFVILVLVFYFSKWYYKKRFGLAYPKFAA
ncbi:MAG: UbiA family prenyltransferase [candidate division KSB1 bacterium]|jgi:4-hydroxybenzoate polyprenyltransferase|nr:UbiA family prenyltransferase [candidate division KSB1 bacterium]